MAPGEDGILRSHEAIGVVEDLGEMTVAADGTPERTRRIGELPPGLGSSAGRPLVPSGRVPAVFLDYDGTLTPIVARPDLAVLLKPARDTLIRLASRWPVAILSGRDLSDVRSMVGIDGIAYAGSHGFDILLPDGRTQQRGAEYVSALDAAEEELRRVVEERGSGAWVERKRFAIAVHVRQVAELSVPELERAVAEVAAGDPTLRITGGKKVFELRPATDWDKGVALRFLLGALGLEGAEVLPIYVGDDETDEDAFRAVRGRGIGVVVAGAQEERRTAADLRLADPEEVSRFLDRLASHDPTR
jgi:trehalose 6-phosphate phosphatase